MTVVVVRDVAPRFRGFLASCMLEIGPGVYTAPRMNKAVRERVWGVLQEWFIELGGGSIIMTYNNPEAPGGQEVLTLGCPRYDLFQHDGVYIARKRELKLSGQDERRG